MSEILIVFGGYPSTAAGAERMAWRTGEALSRRGHTVTALTDARPPADLDGGAVRCLRSERELGPGWKTRVVHAYDLAGPDHVAAALDLARRTGVRFALTPATAPQLWPDAALGRAACRAADVVYALTAAEARLLAGSGAHPGRIRLIPHAPDLHGVADPGGFRRRLGLPGPTVVFVGRRIPSKGYAELLRAAPLVWDVLPQTRLLFLGPGTDPVAAATFRAHADPRIVDLGAVDEQTKHDAIAAADVLCLPSRADVFPLVFLEAWTCGKPVVSGDFEGVESVVEHGVDGLVVEVGPAEIAQALVRLLSDAGLRSALGRAGRARVRRGFTWDRVAASVEAGY